MKKTKEVKLIDIGIFQQAGPLTGTHGSVYEMAGQAGSARKIRIDKPSQKSCQNQRLIFWRAR